MGYSSWGCKELYMTEGLNNKVFLARNCCWDCWNSVGIVVAVQSLSHVWLCDPVNCSTPGFPSLSLAISWRLLKLSPLSQWCHPTISFSVIPFSSCLQSFPVSGSFLMSWVFASGSQSIGASASVLPMNIQAWFPLGLTGLISLESKGLRSLLQHHS